MALVSETLKANLSFAPQSALGEIPSYSCNQTKALLILMFKSGFLPAFKVRKHFSESETFEGKEKEDQDFLGLALELDHRGQVLL